MVPQTRPRLLPSILFPIDYSNVFYHSPIMTWRGAMLLLQTPTYHTSLLDRGGRDSSAGIATRYGLDGLGIESRRGARFSASVQTCPGAHPASCKMGTGSLPRVKRPVRGADPHHHLQCRGLKKGRVTPLPTLRALVVYKGGTFTFFTWQERQTQVTSCTATRTHIHADHPIHLKY